MEGFLGRAPFGTALSDCLKLIALEGLFLSCHFCREAAKSEPGAMSALSRLTSFCSGTAPCFPVVIPTDPASTGIAFDFVVLHLRPTTERTSLQADAVYTNTRRYMCTSREFT